MRVRWCEPRQRARVRQLLKDLYGKGILYVLTIPDSLDGLYRLPQGVLSALRNYIREELPETLDAPRMVEARALPPARQGRKNRGISNASQRTGFENECCHTAL
jgi:hypothetical protein